MNPRIANTFAKLSQQQKPAFISFITAGDPDLKISEALLASLPSAGVDIIELGMPFSDPMADGVTIQEASQRALNAGVTTLSVLEMVKKFRAKNDTTPIVLMGYFNPINAMGLETFALNAKKAGVDGVLVVDLPPEEADDLKMELNKNNLDLIFLIAPTTDDKRLNIILKKASGFLYYVSITGVTGTKLANFEEVAFAINTIKRKTKLPIVTGFGIKTPEMVANISTIADGVVVGSAIVEKLANEFKTKESQKNIINNVLSFVTTLANSTKKNNNSNN